MLDVFEASLYDIAIPVNMASLVFLLGFWAMSVLITATLNRLSEKFRSMELRHKRNIVTYIFQIGATTASLSIFTVVFPRFITVSRIEDPFTKEDMKMASIASGLVFYLYIFELVYKTSVNFSLMVHHILAIGMTCLTCFFLWDTMNPAAVYLMILLYSAVTEQPVFIALLLYRFGYKCRWWFRFAAATGLLFKGSVFGLGFLVLQRALLDVHFTNYRNDFGWKSFMTIVFPVVNVVLLVVQVYCIHVYWALGEKSHIATIGAKDDPYPPRKSLSASTVRTDGNGSIESGPDPHPRKSPAFTIRTDVNGSIESWPLGIVSGVW